MQFIVLGLQHNVTDEWERMSCVKHSMCAIITGADAPCSVYGEVMQFHA